MTDQELVAGRLSMLREYLGVLRLLAARTIEEFNADLILAGALQHYLRVAAELMIETATHILAEEGLPVPDTYRGVFECLATSRKMDLELSRRLQGWAGLRNILVHRYLSVDLERLLQVLQQELRDVTDFASWAAEVAGLARDL